MPFPDHNYLHSFNSVTAMSGMGKTTLQVHRAKQFAKRGGKLYVFDYKGQLAHMFSAKFVARTIRELRAALRAGGSVIFNPHKEFPGDIAAGFRVFLREVWEWGQKFPAEKLILFDEIRVVLGEDLDAHPIFLYGDTGREFRFNLLFNSQYPFDLPVRLRNQINRWTVFKVEAAEAFRGLPRRFKEFQPVIERFGVGDFIEYDQERGQMQKGRLKL